MAGRLKQAADGADHGMANLSNAIMKRIKCSTCENTTTTPDRNGFCAGCAQECDQIKLKLSCPGNCATPMSCLTAKRCACLEEKPEQMQLI